MAEITQDFECCDSSVALLADNAVNVSVDPGAGLVLRVGNQALVSGVSLGFYYTYDRKRPGVVTVNSSTFDNGEIDIDLETFDPSCLDVSCDTTAHFLEWHVGSFVCSTVQWVFGARHVVAGKDVIQTNQFFFQFTACY